MIHIMRPLLERWAIAHRSCGHVWISIKSSKRLGEQLGTYAYLKTTEDVSNDTYQKMIGRYRFAGSEAGQAAAFIKPEIMAIPTDAMNLFLASNELADYKLTLEQMLRYKPHTLGSSEEKLLAMQAEMSETSNQVFRQLNDSDLKFGACKNEKRRNHRAKHCHVFRAFYNRRNEQYEKRRFINTMLNTRRMRIRWRQRSAARSNETFTHAKARGYKSGRENSLFHDNMPLSVYDNLIAAVRKNLPALHKYYEAPPQDEADENPSLRYLRTGAE